MKRLVLFFIFSSLCFSMGLFSQSFDDAVTSYKNANMSRTINRAEDEHKALEKAYDILKGLVTEEDDKPLTMLYLVSLRLEREFPFNPSLFKYVKKEHPGYAAVETLDIMAEDKELLLKKLKTIADKNRQEALRLLAKAKKEAGYGNFSEANNILSEAEKLWNLEDIQQLKSINLQKIIKKQRQDVINRAKELAAQGVFEEALKTVEGAKEVLETSESASLTGEIKNRWYKKVFSEAKIEYKNKKYDEAILKCDEAYSILPHEEALKFKRKCEKRGDGKGSFALFGDFGVVGNLKIEPNNYDWTGNSEYWIFRDRGSITSKRIFKGEGDAKLSYGAGGGLMVLFSSSFGISVSAAYFIKQEFEIKSEYTSTHSWGGDYPESDSELFTDSGTISIIPLSLNLVVMLNMSHSVSLNLYGGPTYFLTDIDIRTHVDHIDSGQESGGYYYFEWYEREYNIENSDGKFGFNAGADLEFKMGPKAGLYMGFQYFFLSPQEYQWQVKEKLDDIWYDRFYTIHPSSLSSLPEYKNKINLSAYKAHMGIKLYF